MKRYMVFGGDHYYPLGGADDFRRDTESLDEAMSEAKAYLNRYKKTGWAHILDTKERAILDENGKWLLWT